MFTFNGLTMEEMQRIHEYYEAACTAEYVMENHGIENEEDAIKIGCEVRRCMNKYGIDEEEAITMVLNI